MMQFYLSLHRGYMLSSPVPPPCFRWGPVQATMPMTHRTVPLMEKGMEGPQATIEAMAGAPMVSM